MNEQDRPWEWDSHGNPMGNVPRDGMKWDSTHCISMEPIRQWPCDSLLITSYLNRLASIGNGYQTLKFIVIRILWAIELKATPSGVMQQLKEKG